MLVKLDVLVVQGTKKQWKKIVEKMLQL